MAFDRSCGACQSEVVISDKEIDFPKVVKPDIFVVLSQHSYNKYAPDVKIGGTILLDPNMIPSEKTLKKVKIFKVTATKIAEKIGRKLVANIVMLGALAAITPVLSKTALRNSIKVNVPKGTGKINLSAFQQGFEYGKNLLEN